MVNAICQEIRMAGNGKAEPIETIYFGGGTPSLLSPEQLDRIMNALHENFAMDAHAEITIEANPDDISPALLDAWKQAGLNRISLGVQSFDEKELRWMNRAHGANQSRESLLQIRAAGFTNFSADLIYGLPGMSLEELEQTIKEFLQYDIPHLSCYALTVEPKTVLANNIDKGKATDTDSALQASHFAYLVKALQEAGYEQYEISNFAKPGFRSRHNSSYWQGKAYHGFGPAAHGFDGLHTRRWNMANNSLYIQSITSGIQPFEEEILTPAQSANEYIMTSLRTSEGMHMGTLQRMLSSAQIDTLLQRTIKYIEGNLLYRDGDVWRLTDEGKFLADGIAADLFVD